MNSEFIERMFDIQEKHSLYKLRNITLSAINHGNRLIILIIPTERTDLVGSVSIYSRGASSHLATNSRVIITGFGSIRGTSRLKHGFDATDRREL